ncbi:hypothetical protein PDE_01505 [Penicillium oxalicum 114-2]|uniref:Nucleoporin Pom152 n=1 Tax=Penicillium oxalicum (strain 114-2 / CGMCC 5302) TaxID=933388 RepID=S8AL34_PENO1|nr:hypothetical protein PDE_01505 [Penicillium oxalicum 114-2]
MNGTPRLPSAFPQTPTTIPRRRLFQTPSRSQPRELPEPRPTPRSPAKVAQPPTNPNANAPLVPAEVIDAPTQRLYVVAFYLALNAYRIYESWNASDELDSTWLFLKWVTLDGVFLFGLQALRIPWLEWAFPTTLALFLLHVVGNIFLMFRIPIPLGAWLGGMVKVAYDRELSISERKVKPGDIIHNASLILGKQIVHILPEGSAVLNPEREPLCLDSQKTSVYLPIRVNQTDPILIEILRLDLHTGENETLTIPAKQLKQLKRQADKRHAALDPVPHRDLHFPVRKTGVYRLQRVVDESQLDVRTRTSDALVVSCPHALIKNSYTDKCRGELSNILLEVEGTPPLKIKYSREVNFHDRGVSVQNVQPDNLRTPLLNQKQTGALFSINQPDVSWAQSQKISVPLNESLNVHGDWFYAIEEVHDALGNIANYSSIFEDGERPSTKSSSQWHQLVIHERPLVSLVGCNEQRPLEVARGDSANLPIGFQKTGKPYDRDGPFTVTYSFNPNSAEQKGNGPQDSTTVVLKTLDQQTPIKEPGWYTLTSVSSHYCPGEVMEPSSCNLRNPPEPELSIKTEKVFDRCANNAVGLLVDLDLTGSPPFRVRYSIEGPKGVQTQTKTVDGLRSQLDFTPSEAGFYRYRFLDVEDSIYSPRSLKDKVPILEQDVKPPASAHFLGSRDVRKACFGESISVDLAFLGEAPWTLQYELVHNGKRTRYTLESETDVATITTDKLVSGGEYRLALTSVKDKSNCKRNLKDSIKINARSKPPHVAFGQIDKKRTVSALAGSRIEIPLRFSGEKPWTMKYKNVDTSTSPLTKTFWNENSNLVVDREGLYELLEIYDNSCSGFVDQSAKEFEVSWIPRPKIISVDGSPVVKGEYTKPEVCQGDDDSLELRLSGSPPFSLQYEQRRKSERGQASTRAKTIKTALNSASMEMDTSEPGQYTYKFSEVGDNLYDYDPRSSGLVVTQKVNSLPSAKFDSPGHIYGFCKEDATGEETVPITLEGVPPFSLEIVIKHHSNAKPEIVTIPNINSNHHKLALPRRHLDLGQHVVSIHKVRDSRGCQRTTEFDASSVRVAVSDVPTIIPLESKVDYCVGERLSFSLSGHAPFEVFYTFNGVQRKASSPNTNFRRIAERPGQFTITAVGDSASGKCKAHKDITKVIHEMPSVRISQGQVSVVDIHEGGEAELNFEFWGTPPFEFTYIRSTNARRGKKPEVLDIKHDISYEHKKAIKTSDEGTYEVVAIKDKYCSFSSQMPTGKSDRSSS